MKIPVKWNVETSRADSLTIEAFHGETLALEAALHAYGKPLAPDAQDLATLYWQKPGMGDSWWSAPATIEGNRLRADFTPAMDPGEPALSGFIGIAGSAFRAAFTLRLRSSPGAAAAHEMLVAEAENELTPTAGATSMLPAEILAGGTVPIPTTYFLDVRRAKTLYSLFRKAAAETIILPQGFGSEATDASYLFASCRNIKEIAFPPGFGRRGVSLFHAFDWSDSCTRIVFPDDVRITNLAYAFNVCKSLEEIVFPPDSLAPDPETGILNCLNMAQATNSLKRIVFPDNFGTYPTTVTNILSGATALETVEGGFKFDQGTFSIYSTTSLTRETILHLFDEIRPVASGKTGKFTFAAAALARVTEDEIKVATDKGWSVFSR